MRLVVPQLYGCCTNAAVFLHVIDALSFMLVQYRGRANLHVFEDWCGSSTDDLRRNLHYPLYPHIRTTVSKLAVSPRWNNYGLRIFGYLHPYVDGEFVFALGSDDNSELWLSADDSPLNSELLAWVGKTGSEWTTPGEFEKYASQTSRPVWLSAQRRYFFEVIHKQNDRGTDHVEVADFRLKIIESKYISLYTDESALLISDVAHIPQTAASNQHATAGQRFAPAEMLRDDPRDAFYQGEKSLSKKFLEGVLPDCSYKPSYTIKDYPLSRYQGLQFIHMSYIYPNDYTRLTHMETQDSCFYPERPYQMAMFGFSRYMKLDLPPDTQDKENGGEETQSRLDHVDNALFPDYGDDFDDYALKRRRRIFSVDAEESDNELSKIHHQQDQAAVKQSGPDEKAKQVQPTVNVTRLKAPKKRRVARVARSLPPLPVDNEPLQAKQQASNRSGQIQRLNKSNRTQIRRPKGSQYQNLERAAPLPEKDTQVKNDHMEKENNFSKTTMRRGKVGVGEEDSSWLLGGDFEDAYEEETTPKIEYDTVVSWNQTFQVNLVDLQAIRSDWIDLKCNISGNLLLHSSDALPIVTAFMEQLNAKHNGQFTLMRVINVVKRVDGFTGSRYLLELELKDVNGRILRLSHYIYALIRQPRHRDVHLKRPKPQILLCNPVGFRWNPSATVHFIVPVKNQARWVQQLIVDMEWLYRQSGDANFNLIITDYNSTDMDVRKALEKSSLPRYQYIKLSGNFKRSAGLQAGIDLIDDDHSIVFLCDLHIRFPPSIIDTIRKHCVEGYMAFAPIVLRLDCGVTPSEARGYWEVNGFGLLGIYKSDLVAAGGMNTREFTEQWGGEDWELLDRILQAGLEVERIFLRNFFHHYHSKRGMWNRKGQNVYSSAGIN
uniref:Beta-1,4-N-acetylgalactosaminyltransferase n=1 Tax=Salarias fasciatus TaxID=181472 RepID=A0A672ILD3_SALFA